uniref:Reverse transcriptase domain-containing protein n=1 Tax=Tanacetum cinerariifolium TaxID=118510 RepID=A0A6L2NDG6_TANCI|nr:reverse transcriptase domain-containing protein [Tanacetum cinerariifolium]
MKLLFTILQSYTNHGLKFDKSFHEALDRYRDLLHVCPHHGFTELHQLDTFNNAFNPADQDSLNSVAGGNLLERCTQDVFTIIKNKSKVHNSRNKSIVYQVKSGDATSSSSEIAKLTHAINQQTSAMTIAITTILKQFQATPPPASVKAVQEICVTCGGAYSYYQCLTAGGNTFLALRDNIQGYVSAAAEDERVDETLTDQDLAEYTIKFIFSANFVIVDYESDPRVLLILGRPFLRTARALIDVHGEEMILRDVLDQSIFGTAAGECMRTRSSSNLPVESPPNPLTFNPKRHNRRCSKQPFILEESPVDTMADQRTMAELLRAPTEGYAEAIVVPLILAEQFELKHSLINMMTSYRFFGLEKENPYDHIRTTNLRNETSNFQQRFDESFHEAWDRYKDLLHACPHHGFTELHQLDTFYNALNPTDQYSLNSAKLTYAVNQQTSYLTTARTAILKQFQATLPLASVKAIKEIYVTCGGANPYYQSLVADGNTFPELQNNIQGYVSAVAVNYNQGNSGYHSPGVANQIRPSDFAQLNVQNNQNQISQPQGYNRGNNFNQDQSYQALTQQNQVVPLRSGSLPNNTIANPKGELKAITTQSGIIFYGPFVPIPPLFIKPKEDERVEETLTDQDLAVILKKLPEKLGDPRKFLIPCGFSELKCKALANLGASINLMPLSVCKKLGLPELISTRMTLELANRAICTPVGIARDVFVQVGKFTFPADFVIVDYESDPRVPLILGRPFLWIARALIDVHREEMILRDEGGNVLFEKLLDLDSTKDPREKLLNINLLLAKIKSLNDKPTPDHVLKPPSYSPIPNFIIHTEETNSGSTTTYVDYSLPKYDSFLFKIELDQGKLTSIVMKDNLAEPRVHELNVLTTHPTLMLDSDFIPSDNFLPEYEIFYFDIEEKNSGSTTIHADISLPDIKCFKFKIKPDPGELTSIVDFEIRENDLSPTNVNLPPEEDHSPLFAYVVLIFLSFFYVSRGSSKSSFLRE